MSLHIPYLQRLKKSRPPLPPTLNTSLSHTASIIIIKRIRLISSRIIRRSPNLDILKLHSPIPLSILTLNRSLGLIPRTNHLQTSSYILPANRTLKHFECNHGLIVRYLVAGLVDTQERELSGLLHLAVDDGVGGRDVDVACGCETWGVDF